MVDESTEPYSRPRKPSEGWGTRHSVARTIQSWMPWAFIAISVLAVVEVVNAWFSEFTGFALQRITSTARIWIWTVVGIATAWSVARMAELAEERAERERAAPTSP